MCLSSYYILLLINKNKEILTRWLIKVFNAILLIYGLKWMSILGHDYISLSSWRLCFLELYLKAEVLLTYCFVTHGILLLINLLFIMSTLQIICMWSYSLVPNFFKYPGSSKYSWCHAPHPHQHSLFETSQGPEFCLVAAPELLYLNLFIDIDLVDKHGSKQRKGIG